MLWFVWFGWCCVTATRASGLRGFNSPQIIMANQGLGVPVKLLHESLGHIITVELKTGQLYRGKLAEGRWLFFL